jgi:hypothetical protein
MPKAAADSRSARSRAVSINRAGSWLRTVMFSWRKQQPGHRAREGTARLDHEARDGRGPRGSVLSPNRIICCAMRLATVLAETRTTVPGGFVFAVRNGARRKRFLCRQCGPIVRFTYIARCQNIDHGTERVTKLIDLPGAPLNHHWTRTSSRARTARSSTHGGLEQQHRGERLRC